MEQVVKQDETPAADLSAGWNEALTPQHVANPPTPARSDNIILWQGQEIEVSADEGRIKAQFETWVRRNARLAIAIVEQEEGPASAAMERSTFQRDSAAGAYTWDGSHCINARARSTPGLVHLLWLMIVRCHPTFKEDDVRDMYMDHTDACLHAIAWSLGNFPSRLKRLGQAGTNGQQSKQTSTTQTQKPTLDG